MLGIFDEISDYRYEKKKDKNQRIAESFLPEMNSAAEKEYKKFSHSKTVQALAQEILSEKKSLSMISVYEKEIHLEFTDKTKKQISFSEKGLPPLSDNIEIGTDLYPLGGLLHTYARQYPYLTFCQVCNDNLTDGMAFGCMYFNQQKAVAYILAKKVDMPIEDDGYGISSTFFRKNTPTKSWY